MDRGKICFVSGADRGLGLSFCRQFLKKGAYVFAGRYLEEWQELDVLRKEYPDRLTCIPLDISDTGSVREAARMTAKHTEQLDLLVNCAGIDGQLRDIRDGFDYDRMLRVINVNALGPVRMIEFFLPLLAKGEKRIWNISSEAGSIGNCWRTNEEEYCMSKAALNMGIRILDNLLRREGFDFRLYHPGWMNTYMAGKKETKADLDPDDAAQFACEILSESLPGGTLCLQSYDRKIYPW